jgi:hypothetical protein
VNRVPLAALQAAARFILINGEKFAWSLQGMGMLRVHMGNARLHVWDQNYAVPGVSMIHDHLQWGLRSTIVAGELVNQRYVEADYPRGRRFNCVTLKAGYGCKFVEEPRAIWLYKRMPEEYRPGDTYEQLPGEIHETKPQGIVVTLMEKSPTGSDLARVFWPYGMEWGSAEPREATSNEVAAITAKAVVAIDAAREVSP